jgi:hypothetical protein
MNLRLSGEQIIAVPGNQRLIWLKEDAVKPLSASNIIKQ